MVTQPVPEALCDGDRTAALRVAAAHTLCPLPPATTAWEIHPEHIPAALREHVARIPVTPGCGPVRVIFGVDNPAPRYAEHDGHALLLLTRAPLLDQHRAVVALVDRLCAEHRTVAHILATLPALDQAQRG